MTDEERAVIAENERLLKSLIKQLLPSQIEMLMLLAYRFRMGEWRDAATPRQQRQRLVLNMALDQVRVMLETEVDYDDEPNQES